MSHRSTSALGFGALAALGSLSVFAACGNSDSTEPKEAANVRIVNVSPTVGPVTASTEGKTVQSGVAFQSSAQTGGCGTVEQGSDEEIQFVNAGTTSSLGSVKYNFVAQHDYLVVFYAPSNAAVYRESFTAPSAGNNALRFINATASAGDLYVTAPSATISGPPTIANFAASQVSGFDASTAPGGTFAFYPGSNVRVRLFDPGQTTNPRIDFNVSGLPSNNVGTVILTMPATNGPSAFMVGACTG